MINKEDILQATRNGLDVFKYYIPFEFRLGKNFKNPFYEDTVASCNVYFDRHNSCFKIKDFGNSDFSGDCFAFVAKLNDLDVKLNFLQVLQIIICDLSLHLEKGKKNRYNANAIKPKKVISSKHKSMDINLTSNTYSPTIEEKQFTIKEKPFSEGELLYWKQYGIAEKLLKKFEVKSLYQYNSQNNENKAFSITSTPQEPMFGYQGNGYIKLYRPNSKIRFMYGGQLPDNYCFGMKQLPNRGDILFLTGGEKDVMSLTARGFYAICFNSETSLIPPDIIEILSLRFKHIILLYDVDKAGIEASLKHQEMLAKYSLKRLELPLSGSKSEKDISDYFKLGNTAKNLKNLILILLKSIYENSLVMLNSCEVDFSNPPLISENIVTINSVPLGTQGNILCVTGGEGTGKSNYAGAILAGTLSVEDYIPDTLGLDIEPNKLNKAVLLYDTEQSENQLYKNVGSILRRANVKEKPDSFKAFYLTAMSRKERLLSIQNSMDYYYHLFNGIHIVVIDGIADLIRSANDEIESIAIVEELYRLAGIYRTCILCVLHFVPNSIKLRGHLGSELQRKSAAILAIETDTNPAISVVKALKVRDGSPLDVPIMQFAWDKQKAMHVYLGEKTPKEKNKRKENELLAMAKDIFSITKQITYNDLVQRIVEYMDISERTAKSYIKFMREHNIIVKNPHSNDHFIIP